MSHEDEALSELNARHRDAEHEIKRMLVLADQLMHELSAISRVYGAACVLQGDMPFYNKSMLYSIASNCMLHTKSALMMAENALKYEERIP